MQVKQCKAIHCKYLDREYNKSCQQCCGAFICRANGGVKVKELEICEELTQEPQFDEFE